MFTFITEIVAEITRLCTHIISSTGYFGVFFLMILESMIIPLPSELVMPFAGFLAAKGEFNFWLVILASSLGSLVGSLLSYYLGKNGIDKFLEKHGRYFLVTKKDLELTRKWFNKKGEFKILVARQIPVVRHIISIFAGMGEMNIWKFSLYTLIGATIWNAFLAYLGYLLGQNWGLIRKYTEPFSILMAVILVIGASYFIYTHLKKHN